MHPDQNAARPRQVCLPGGVQSWGKIVLGRTASDPLCVEIQGEAVPRPSFRDSQNPPDNSKISRLDAGATTPHPEATGPMCESHFTLFTDELLIFLWLTSRKNWQSPCTSSGRNAAPAKSSNGVAHDTGLIEGSGGFDNVQGTSDSRTASATRL